MFFSHVLLFFYSVACAANHARLVDHEEDDDDEDDDDDDHHEDLIGGEASALCPRLSLLSFIPRICTTPSLIHTPAPPFVHCSR